MSQSSPMSTPTVASPDLLGTSTSITTGLEIPCVRIVDDLDILQLGKVNIWAGVETKDEAAHTVFSGGAKRDAKICHSALVDYDGAIVGMGIAQRRQTRLLPESGRPCLLVALVLLKERPQSPSHLLARGVHHIGIQFLVQPAGDTVEMAGRITDFPMLLVFFTQMKDQAIIDFGRRQHRVTKDGEAFRCPTDGLYESSRAFKTDRPQYSVVSSLSIRVQPCQNSRMVPTDGRISPSL